MAAGASPSAVAQSRLLFSAQLLASVMVSPPSPGNALSAPVLAALHVSVKLRDRLTGGLFLSTLGAARVPRPAAVC